MRRSAAALLALAAALPSSGSVNQCRWVEHENTRISCSAGGDLNPRDLMASQSRCEELGSDCTGVTCEALHVRCSVRNEHDCEGGVLGPSEIGETSYTKHCDFTPTPPQQDCSQMRDVKQRCGGDTSCTVLATNMRGRSCAEYCGDNGLTCISAAEEEDDSCTVQTVWLCDQPYLDSSKLAGIWTSDLLCTCGPLLNTPPPTEPATHQPGQLPRCHWDEKPNSYITCYAEGEKDEGDLLERELRCEALGDKCAGVTCEGLHTKCTVRHNASCEAHEFLAPSASGETSYVPDCRPPAASQDCADLPDVQKVCGSNGCKVLAGNMRGKTCTQYCARKGLLCVAAWEEADDDCSVYEAWLCDQPYLNSSKAAGVWTSDLICECMVPPKHHTPAPPRPTAPPGELPTCRWKEHKNAFISCHAQGETVMGDFLERQRRCEQLGPQCVGITCENEWQKCTVRHPQHCDVHEFLSPSPSGETSYVKNCSAAPTPGGCGTLPDKLKDCGSNGCKVLATNMRGKTCTHYCALNGLTCLGAWEERDDQCEVAEVWLCDQPYMDSSKSAGIPTSDLMCECAPAAPPGAASTPEPPPPPIVPGEQPKCRWTEKPNSFISCHAQGDITVGHLLERQRACEAMGSDCAGVTCEDLWQRCTVRHNKHCSIDEWLAPSESGETSYVKDCNAASGAGTCDAMKDWIVRCPDSKCKVLATNMRGRTCATYCQEQGLTCVSAAEERSDSCTVYEAWLCDQPYLDSGSIKGVWTSDLICECAEPNAPRTPVPTMPSLAPAMMPKCKWKEHPNAYISCFAEGDSTEGNLLEAEHHCEGLGDKCEGVTCEGLHDRCTVRHRDGCAQQGPSTDFLAPSPSGETSYVADCRPPIDSAGRCEDMKDVLRDCGKSSCLVLAGNMRGRTCSQFCAENGLVCIGAWEEEGDSCVVHEDWLCDQPYLNSSNIQGVWTSDLLCECTAKEGKDQDAQKGEQKHKQLVHDPKLQPKCHWTEHSNTYISCHATGEKDEGDLLERQHRCEELGEQCAGVTCEELYSRCTVRHWEHCEGGQMLGDSPSGETSYTKDCTSPGKGGKCTDLKDVKRVCSEDKCTVLAGNMRGSTCRLYCEHYGLDCVGAWEEVADTCTQHEAFVCDKPYLDSSRAGGTWTSDLICQCQERADSGQVNAPPAGEGGGSGGGGGGGGGAGTTVVVLLVLALVGAAVFVVYRNRTQFSNFSSHSRVGFRPLQQETFGDDDGLFGEDAEEVQQFPEQGHADVSIPAPPQEERGAEV